MCPAQSNQMGNSPRAIELIQHAINACPTNHHLYNSLAEAYGKVEDHDRAIVAYQKALSLNPRSTEALINLGLLYKRQNALQQAIACYQKAIAVDPNLPIAYSNLGTAFSTLGDLVKSAACYRRALALDPAHVIALFNFGNVLQKMGDLNGAIACYRRVLALDSCFILARLNLGLAYHAMGCIEAAIDALESVLRQDPHNAEAVAYLLRQYQQACDWGRVTRLSAKLDQLTRKAIEKGVAPAEPPFLNISRHMDPDLNLAVARLWSRRIQERAAAAEPFSSKKRANTNGSFCSDRFENAAGNNDTMIPIRLSPCL